MASKFPKMRELKKLTIEEMKAKMEDLNKQLIKINAQVAMGTVPQNPGSIKPLKKTLAKIKVLLIKGQKPAKGGEKKGND